MNVAPNGAFSPVYNCAPRNDFPFSPYCRVGTYSSAFLASNSKEERALLIDAQGCELGTLAGPAEWASDDAIKLIETAKGP